MSRRHNPSAIHDALEHFNSHQAKIVFVRAYTRIRFGTMEHVHPHWRSPPRQLSFYFD